MMLGKFQQKTVAWVLLAIITIIWGTSFILIKKSLVAFDAAEVGALRMLTAGIVLIPIALKNYRNVKVKNWGALFTVGFLGSFIPAFLFAKAETKLDSSLAGVLNALVPIFVLLIGALFFAQKFTRAQVFGILIGFSGTVILVLAGSYGSLSNINLYGLFVVLATICYGLNANILKFRLYELNALTITSISLVMVMPIALIYILFFTDVYVQVVQEPQARLSFMYVSILGIMSTAIAMGLFNKLIQITTPIFSSSVTYLIPLVAVTWGLWDGEVLLIGHYLGMFGILSGVYITNRKK